MSTKYSITRSKRWRWDHEQGRPNLTTHLQDRYDERTPYWSSSPETAWTNGIDVTDLAPYLEDRGGQIPEQVRYYAELSPDGRDWHGIVLLVYDSSLVTCYTHESLKQQDQGAALQAFLSTLAVEEGYI